MARRALLIGAQTYGLRGVDNDVDAMATVLSARGFTITPCQGPDATRDGILDAYEQLISSTQPGDAAVVFYSGHGASIEPPAAARAAVLPTNRRFIVPVDMALSTPADFRGITGIELSVLLSRLTARTRNVTVVLDCCYAGTMSRDGNLTAKSLIEPWKIDLDAHLRRRLREGLRIDLTRPLGDPYAVRVVACAPDQRANEYGGRRGERIGVFTEALTDALAGAGDAAVSWSTLIGRVRQNVGDAVAHQRPDAEGPARRLLFELDEKDDAGSLPVVAVGPGRVRLDGAPLFGVQPGDRFLIMPAGSESPSRDRALASVRIDGCGPADATGRLDPPAHADLPVGARAFRVAATAPRLPVEVPPDLVPAVERSTFVRMATPGERPALRVRADAAGLFTVSDAIGPLHAPRPWVVPDLERVAKATALRRIASRTGWELDARVAIGWGRVPGGLPEPLPLANAPVRVGDPVYVCVRNDDDDPVYVSLLDIGVSARISILDPTQPSGRRLHRGEEYVLGRDDRTGRLTGLPLSWPPGLDASWPRPETILALVTSRPLDVTVLEQGAVSRSVREPQSPLEALLSQVTTGATRDLLHRPAAPDRYAALTIEFDLHPRR
ncbi:caspase family protein [Couchioplanes caeruleus]|uniref:caspase family protein n=1 Tax=Couchioplanes caeruleus TaxID=56438 RepID=UPI0020BE1F16|nr:caspase family protein [Couchioplanes caeruleus]UQU64303.1 caspase family protein [Couchioplanes caeruleus]